MVHNRIAVVIQCGSNHHENIRTNIPEVNRI
jgi:hypothetical protein